LRAPKSYLAILVGPLIGLGHWLLEELAREQAWWHSVPFAWLIEVWAAFTLGMIVQDVANPESWISGKLRAARRNRFVIHGFWEVQFFCSWLASQRFQSAVGTQ
jgi:hypothetical protein